MEWQIISAVIHEKQDIYYQSASASVLRPMSTCIVGGEVMHEEESEERTRKGIGEQEGG